MAVISTYKFSVKPFVPIITYRNVSRTFSREELLKSFFFLSTVGLYMKTFNGQETEVAGMAGILSDNIPLLPIKYPRHFE